MRPGTGDPVAPGEVGEVVITSFNKDYPLIRFATGDLSAVLPGASPCGRTNVRIKGWMGRADQSTKVRAMFVTPRQVDDIVRRHPEVARARLVVEGEAGNDRMTLQVRSRRAARRTWPKRSSPRSATSPSCAARSSWSRPAACRTTAR